METSATTVTINGVPVDFPFEPYDLQKEYMEKVLDCLQNETNGVLESPTGTGKTLSLLCASLAWLQLKKAQLQAQRQISGSENPSDFLLNLVNKLGGNPEKSSTSRAFLGVPTIIYASRTHSQLSQAMQELKRTSYSHMKASVLGSREQMCIHPELLKENNAMKTQMCKLKVKTRSCQFYNQVERKKVDPSITQVNVMDIEDIVKLAKQHRFCPYFMTKELKQQADIIFMPYNYLLDPIARKALGVELFGNVIILDEAHNIERICEDSASLQLKSTDITLAIEETTAIMKIISDDSFNMISNANDQPRDFDSDELCTLKQILLDFETELDKIALPSNSQEGSTFEASFMFELYKKAGICDQNADFIINLIEKIIQFLSTINDGPFQRRGNGLQLFQDMLRIVFAGHSPTFKEKVNKCYKVHVKYEEGRKKTADNWLSKSTTKLSGRVLSYWCFSPGFGMNMLMDTGVRCVILTSGTLAPLKPLISELELNVTVRLENPHIVKGDQVCVKIVTQGPDLEILNSNFQNRDNPKYLNSLGGTILNLTRIIPAGLLIFFPSYPIMQKCQQFWQENGTWSKINSHKTIFVEPRDKESFNSTMIDYYDKIQDANYKGAIFMGVCRGKVSEGLDFADANGRAVIITGLPFPPLKDPRIILKKRYLDVCNAKDKEYLRGDEWYSLEASRAVNQAIGRVIRHRFDYGAIILLDTRFNSPRIKSQLSMWLRDHIKVVNNFGEIVRDLRGFFRQAEAKLPAATLKPEIEAPSAPVEFVTPSTYKKGNFDFSSSILTSDNSSDGEVMIHKRTSNDVQLRQVKKKKINVVAYKPSGSSEGADNTPKEYIVMVKKTLDADSFKEFVKAVSTYRENADFAGLIVLLDKIFISKPSVRYIIQGLEPYIKEHDKVNFENYWIKMRL